MLNNKLVVATVCTCIREQAFDVVHKDTYIDRGAILHFLVQHISDL